MIAHAVKPKNCRECKAPFTPRRPLQPTCDDIACKTLFALKVAAKAERKREKFRQAEVRAQKADDKAKLESLKTARDYIKPAQDAFNAFIRERDKDQPCICCGRFASNDDWTPGGTWDAGHFLSRGAYPELRFEETNCHRQLKTCNGGSSKYARKGRTVSQGYREGIVARIGVERVEWLEGPHDPKHYTVEDLKAIKAHYVEKLKELRA